MGLLHTFLHHEGPQDRRWLLVGTQETPSAPPPPLGFIANIPSLQQGMHQADSVCKPAATGYEGAGLGCAVPQMRVTPRHTAPPVCCGTDPEIPEIPICTKGTLKPAPGALFLLTGAVQAWINARAVETSKLLTPSLLPRQRDRGWSGSLRPFLRLPSFSASPASQPAAKGACFPGRCHNAATHRAASERQCQTRCPEYKNK